MDSNVRASIDCVAFVFLSKATLSPVWVATVTKEEEPSHSWMDGRASSLGTIVPGAMP